MILKTETKIIKFNNKKKIYNVRNFKRMCAYTILINILNIRTCGRRPECIYDKQISNILR